MWLHVGSEQLAVQATVNILDWKLMLKMELSVGCLQQPTAVTLTQSPENLDRLIKYMDIPGTLLWYHLFKKHAHKTTVKII